MNKPPTPKQRSVLRYIAAHIREHKYPPTQDELAEALGCSPTNARSYLLALERRGLITRVPGGYRCISVTPEGDRCIREASKKPV